MITALLVILVLLIFMEVNRLLSRRSWKQRLKIYIHEKFGAVPKEKEWNDKVKEYWKLTGDDDGLDDITWNDLSMNGMFNRINNCDTSAGEEILYWKLRRNDMEDEEREIFEKRVSVFGRDEKLREETENILCNIGKESASYYIPSYMDGIGEYRLKYGWLCRVLQILLVLSLIAAAATRTSAAEFACLAVCVVNLVLYMMTKMKYEVELGLSDPAIQILEAGKKLSEKEKIRELFPVLSEETAGFKKVLRGSRFLRTQRANTAAGDVGALLLDYLMGITLWQLTVYDSMVRRLSEKAEEYLEVYREIGEMDAAVSTASFRQSLPWYCVPEFGEENGPDGNGRNIFMEDVYHPLIDDPVENTLELNRGCLITGSNASGKSTFIKAVAVNVVLAQAFNTCAAGKMRMPHVQVLTSMAVRDDLMAGESYFIREIRYLKRILDHLNDRKVTLCVIDEILRGTNTGERIRASHAILEYLAGKNCIPLIASHDKELTVLLDRLYDNYHFSEEMGEGDISFSYKIMKGPATSQNAVKLLKIAGFPEEILEKCEETDETLEKSMISC
ncbi:MAG TPA: hypothetical protein H9723_10515 [Candidatus Mediterraneibacter stercoravium]|uniref:DNA mismatch repair proteins mutS family domain-containing protein n=1 Tax=Candidatus Mediterraneibacter stercoravium TaxID=2838685 RepID=A0A9D2K1J2_9FIRM|nr:hypothetical protein [Candidatus Mediterraneibacter stercoravium]